MGIFLFILGLLFFISLVLVHEWGHFIMARRNGVEVEEFGLGFPPRAKVLKKHKGTIYSLNWLPLGGFVKLKGEHDIDTEPGTFGAASTPAKIKIMMAGVVMNFITAFILFTLVALIGMPKLVDNQTTVWSDTKIIQRPENEGVIRIGGFGQSFDAGLRKDDKIISVAGQNVSSIDEFNVAVYDNSGKEVEVVADRDGDEIKANIALSSSDPVIDFYVKDSDEGLAVSGFTSRAAEAGLQKEDDIISVAGIAIDKPDQLVKITRENAGKDVEVVVKRGDETITKQIQLRENSPYIGISPYSAQEGLEIRRSTWSAPIVGIGVMKDFTVATMKGLGNALSGLGSIIAGAVTGNTDARQAGQAEASSQVAGPVGIFAVLYEISKLGIGLVLFIIAIISLTLAIMNALPIPALDGGRLFVTLLFRAFKKPLKPELEERIHGTGFAALMLLFVLITVVDIRRFF